MTTVLSVLRSGGDFDRGHVARLAHQVREHSPKRTAFLCLTDQDLGGMGWPLFHEWPGWWSKIEALQFPGPCLYLDLDVNVTGDLTPLLEAAADHDFLMIESLWGPDDPNRWNSSVMGWRGDAPLHVYETFLADPEQWMIYCTRRDAWGDQGMIRLAHEGEITAWQKILPGKLLSYKRGALLGEDVSDCRVLVSHGEPRPWTAGGADSWLSARRAA